jgi:16S rRNA (cytidine1402-2'-O)-methyltransferase
MLWIVATPIGNLGDFSPRAQEVLTSVATILCEDTRRTGQLLTLAQIAAPELWSFHEHNEAERLPHVLRRLEAGEDMALVSDAGTPLMADPGYRLVAACRQRGIPVSVVPGPCAAITALVASGLPPYPFAFLGFLPRKAGAVAETLAPYAHLSLTLVWYDRKNRAPHNLEIAFRVLGERAFCLARELTKRHEAFIHGRLGQDIPALEHVLGEVTVVVGPPDGEEPRWKEARVVAAVQDLVGQGASPREAARRVARDSGWPSKVVYGMVVKGGT